MSLKRTVLATMTAAVTGLSALSVTTMVAGAQTAPEITWEDCPVQVDESGAECGRVEVPMYHSDPAGAKIDVGFVKVPAEGQSRGLLFGNPGGPGGDGYSYFGGTQAGFSWPQEIRNEWDRVAVQPRGLPGSTPVNCPEPSNIDPVSLYTRYGAILREACEQGTPGYTASITTENTAGDWEWVRQALGEEKISIMGLSYGTFLGSMYATKYPEHTDKVVLDSGMNPEHAWNGILDSQEQGYLNTLHEFFNWLAANNETYGMGDTPLAAYQAWSNKIVAETGTNPTVSPPPAQVGDIPPALLSSGQTGADVLTAVGPTQAQLQNLANMIMRPGSNQAYSPTLQVTRQLIPATSQWPYLASIINGSEPIPSMQLTEEQAVAMNTSVMMQSLQLCNENQVPANPLDIPNYVWTNFVVGDIFSAPSLMFSSGAACGGAEPVTTPPTLSGAGLEHRPLQIQATGDPQTPYQHSGRMHELMNSHFVTVHGAGHGQVALGNEAVDQTVVEYLRTGTTEVTDLPGLN
ncbi:alpha/beta hydrolase [Corynebacterium sp. A21]|uniref:alpha/beta hydrolase n=1 Tax=Corynebacterium sp. A21 TaxID=3457318 RepID=UPI003FD3F005